MKYKLNAYFATLILTMFGAGATMLIVHVAYNNAFNVTIIGSEGNYASLQQSILNN